MVSLLNPGAEYDLALVARVLEGSASAKDELCERLGCVPRIVADRNARSGRPLREDELLDVVQQVHLSLWRRLDSYRGLAPLEGWVYRFCQIHFVQFIERRARRESASRRFVEERQQETAEPRDEAPADEPPGLIELLRHVSEREAEVLQLRHLEQLPFTEIAQLLGLSPSSVKTSYYRAIAKLREVLDLERRNEGRQAGGDR